MTASVCSLFGLTSVVPCKSSKKYVLANSSSHKARVLNCLAMKQASDSEATFPRKCETYKPSVWSYEYLQSLNSDPMDKELELRAKILEADVKSMIANENDEILTKLEVIDHIQRLGLGYKFEDELKRALSGCVLWLQNVEVTEENLYTAALCFRLLRQHGYDVSQDVFKSYLDVWQGEDVKGLLSLNEACCHAVEGETLMDKARELTTTYLKDLIKPSETWVSRPGEMPRLAARRYIESYGQTPDANPVLLDFANLDFNMVQSTHRSDLKEMSRWWNEMGLPNKLRFARDRLMESFVFSAGMVFEPQDTVLRQALTKVFALIAVIDDIYDIYGTTDELEQFTDAVERWDIHCIENLPNYMRISFLALYNTVNDLAYDTLKKRDDYILPSLIKVWSDMLKAFLQEKRWCEKKETPSFEEYIENGTVSSSGIVLLAHAYFLMTQNITKQGLESFETYHNLLRWPSIIFRLSNDLGTSTAELERGETANSISCYMRDTVHRKKMLVYT